MEVSKEDIRTNNIKELTIKNPFYDEEQLSEEEYTYIITQEDIEEVKRKRINEAINSIVSVILQDYRARTKEKVKTILDSCKSFLLQDNKELIKEIQALEKKQKQLESELQCTTAKLKEKLNSLVEDFNKKCHSKNIHGINDYGIKTFEQLLVRIASHTPYIQYIVDMKHDIYSQIWLNEIHDYNYLVKHRQELVSKYYKYIETKYSNAKEYEDILYNIKKKY